MSKKTYREVIADQVSLVCNIANAPLTEFLTSITNLIITIQVYDKYDIKSSEDFSKALKNTSAYDLCEVFYGSSIVKYTNHVIKVGKFVNWLLDQEAPFFEDDNYENVWYDFNTISDKYNEFVKEINNDNQ